MNRFLLQKIFFWLACLFAPTAYAESENVIVSDKGQVDLASWQSRDEALIEGQWLILPNQFINRNNYKTLDLQAALQDPAALFVEATSLFLENGVPETKAFRASFVMLIKNDKPRSLGILVEGFKNDFEASIYVPDTDFFYTVDAYGSIAQKKALTAAYTTPTRFYNLDSLGMLGRDFYLIINSRSAFYSDRNTLGTPFLKIASSKRIEGYEFSKRVEQFLLLGIYSMLMIYSMTIYLLRREDRSSLTIFFLSLFMGLRYMTTERLFLESTAFYALAPYNGVLMRFVHTLAAMATVTFVYQKFNEYFSRKFFIFGLGVAAFGLLDMVAATIHSLELSLLANLVFIGVYSLVVMPYFIYVGWKAKRAGGIYASICLTLFVLAMVNDFIQVATGQRSPIWMGHFGMLSLATGFALVNAKIFANTFQKTVELNDSLADFNRNLENLVQQKTQEITALLDHIPQGVLSLEIGGVVSKDFSQHLKDILEEENIAGRNFKELILDRSVLSSDLKDQAWQTLQVVIGEHEMNFDANLDKLPTELLYKTRQQSKWVKITWNVETHNFIVRKVLVTLLDVTKEKVLEQEAETQRQEFEIIRELVDAGARKIGQYFVSANALLKDNESLLELPEKDIDHSTIQSMFINMHTIKGGARTLGLKDLARVFHEVEEYYQSILRQGEAIIKSRLVADLKQAYAVYSHYQLVNKNKLNRSEDYSKVVIEREFIEGHYQILREIVSDLDNKDQPIERIVERIHSQKDTIIKLIFDQLPAVFDEYKYKAEKIAKEVLKPKPTFDFNLDPISITPEIKSLLDNCMVHLLRNALCHGIESPEDRLKAMKSEAGTITIKSQVVGHFLNLEIGDDGCGLAIHKLREKGVDSGKLRPQATVQEIAEIIFSPGVSTAEEVTHISGRGVGMDAVRKFLEQHGGHIEIRLGNPKDEGKKFYSFKFLLQIPLQKPRIFPVLLPKIG